MKQELTLAIDVGTGSARAALVDDTGKIIAIADREHEQTVPQFGWAEQRPDDWWRGVVQSISQVLTQVPDASKRIAVISACGQMHGTVLVDNDGRLVRDNAPLWNDKRSIEYVRQFEKKYDVKDYIPESGNPPTPAWPGFKLAWLRDNDPKAYANTAFMVMPKDYINLRLTGNIAMDSGDASCSFLMNPKSRNWSSKMISILGLDANKLPKIREPLEILGSLTPAAANETGLREGTPVLVGGADYPVALLGSGACKPGLASDVTGTSCILTLIAKQPLLDPEICNVATVEGNWASFVLLESGGDAMRWARRAFHERTLSYAEIVSKAEQASAGADALFFLPFLMGERLGQHRNARAQFFGLAAGHGLQHLHRAVLEGVAFAAARHFKIMQSASGQRIDCVIASGGGSKTKLWLQIKASMYGVPIMVPRETECGIIGCVAMAATAIGKFAHIEDGAKAYVKYDEVVQPIPAWQEIYARMQPIFDRLYLSSKGFYNDLDSLLKV